MGAQDNNARHDYVPSRFDVGSRVDPTALGGILASRVRSDMISRSQRVPNVAFRVRSAWPTESMSEFDDEYIETLYAAPRGAPAVILRHRLGSLAGTTHTFKAGKFHLGRRRDCEIRFDSHLDRMVSSLHASIEAADGRWILEDLGSTNGTFVNGREIVGRVSLAHGDEIVLGCDDADGSVGFIVEMTESTLAAPSARAADARATDTKTATPPREPPKELPRPPRPEPARAEPARAEPNPASSVRPDESIEIGGSVLDPGEAASLRGELKALELTLPATRSAAELAARTLAEGAWQRGGVDWSPCPSIAAVLESERLLREADATVTQFSEDHEREAARATERLSKTRERVHGAESRAAELSAEQIRVAESIDTENDLLALSCEPYFARLDELSLVLSEIVARHRPDVDDDLPRELAELRERMTPLIAPDSFDEPNVVAALARRRAAIDRAAELTEAITKNDAELTVARREAAQIENEEQLATTRRNEQRGLAENALRDRTAELAARFSALGAEAARLKLPGIVSAREHGNAVAALSALDAVEARIAEIRRLLAGTTPTTTRDGASGAGGSA